LEIVFEVRVGARAKVDRVDMLAIFKVTKSDDDGFVADAVWTGSGSIRHSGRTRTINGTKTMRWQIS
jgi:hypothetical protein